MAVLTLPTLPDTIRTPPSHKTPSSPPEEPEDTTVRPDIEWIPSYETYKARVARLAYDSGITEQRPASVPADWPAHVNARRVWTGSDFADEGKYVVQLEKEDIQDAERGLVHFKCKHSSLYSCSSKSRAQRRTDLAIWQHSISATALVESAPIPSLSGSSVPSLSRSRVICMMALDLPFYEAWIQRNTPARTTCFCMSVSRATLQKRVAARIMMEECWVSLH
jgi:hypothetical protein